MKKILMVALGLVIVPMLFAGQTKDAITNQAYDTDARDARLATPPTRSVQIDDGRALGDLLMTIDLAAIGVPGGGYSGAGLSWDGTYLYYENQNDHMMYVIDPTGPSVVTSWSAGLPHAWGVGSEANLWVDDAVGSPGMTYEYTWGGTPTGNSFNAMSGGAVWMGDISEWYTPGEIAILAVGGTNAIYTFTVPGGTPITSISDPVWTGISQRALTYDPFNHTFWLGGWNTGTIWEVDANTGAVLRQFNPADASIAGLAYDWQSTLHPTPVLWLATNSTPDYIYMLDADNPAPQTFPWDFEDGLQGWTHTNGQAFPAGWDVEPSGYNPTWTPPDAGDSTFWVDSDFSGGVIQDTAWSPAVVPPTDMAWLVYGYGFNSFSGNDWLAVGVRTFSGGGWNAPVELTTYTADAGPAWDSLDVSPYAADDSIRVFFYYDGDYDWWASFDNVGLYAPSAQPDHDVGTISYDSPTMVPENTTYSPLATVYNFGTNTETFDVTCEINPGAYTSTQTVTALDPGISAQVTFDPFTFAAGVYDVTVYTQLTGDENPANDTLYTTVEASNWLYYDDGIPAAAWAWYDAGNGWGVQFPAPGDLWVDSIAVHIWDTSWPLPGGTDATFRIYDGATEPTNIRQELTGVTVVRGDWNKFELDTTLTHFATGENIYSFYIQVLNYPDCPGLSIDAACSEPSYMWALLAGVFTVENSGGDWLMRIHVITETGISEWISPVAPDALMFSAPTITKAETRIEFTLPEATKTDLIVYDATGRLCTTLLSNRLCAGTHSISANLNLAAGIYFYNLKTESGINIIRKFLLVK